MIDRARHRSEGPRGGRRSTARARSAAAALALLGCLVLAPAASAVKGPFNTFGFSGTLGGQFSKNEGGAFDVAVNSTGTGGANPGDVYVVDRHSNRIQRFDAEGGFISAWGRDVDAVNPATGFEVCTVAANCKEASSGGEGGALNLPRGIAVDQASGNVYVSDSNNNRVEEFSAAGAFVRAFGKDVVAAGPEQADERQRLSVDASAGQFKLSFGADTSADLPFNASAGEVEAALDALPSIGGAGGSVAVSGGPGSPGAPTPYLIVFAGTLADTNLAALAASAGTTPLSGGAGATVVTLDDGAVGFEVCNVAASCKAGVSAGEGVSAGNAGAFDSVGAGIQSIAIAPVGAPNAGDVMVADAAYRRVQEFGPNGAFVRAFGWDVVASGPGNRNFASGPERADEVQSVKVTAAAGQFKLRFGFSGPETPSLPFNASAAEVQAALNALANVSAGGGSVSVSGGPGDATGSSPYRIVFDGGPLAGTNVAAIATTSVGLSGGSPASAVAVATLSPGNSGFEVCSAAALDACKRATEGPGEGGAGEGKGEFDTNAPNGIAEDASGNLYTAELRSNFRVQRFAVEPGGVSALGDVDDAALRGTVQGSDNPLDVAVDPATGTLYVLKTFPAGSDNPPLTDKEVRILEVDPAANGGQGAVSATYLARGGVPSSASGAGGAAMGLALNSASKRLYAAISPAPVFILDNLPAVGVSGVEASELGASTAKLKATISPSQIPLETLYRFEYAKAESQSWSRVPAAADANLGNGSAGGASASCPTPKAASCEVAQSVSGLEVNTTYKFRLIAHTKFNGTETVVEGPLFTTLATPPAVSSGLALWSSPAASGPSLLLGGTVNPAHDPTTYYFQYVDEEGFQADKAAGGDGFGSAQSAPAIPAQAGRSASDVAVHQSLGGLDATRSYRYRLVATNSVGTTRGATRTVAPPQDGDRFYELVSVGDSRGSGVGGEVKDVALDGDRAGFSAQAFGQADSLGGPANPFIAQRGAAGWRVSAMGPEVLRTNSAAAAGVNSLTAAGVGESLWPESSSEERFRGEVQFGVTALDGSHRHASGQLAPVPGLAGAFSEYQLQGATPDLSSFVFNAHPGGAQGFRLAAEEPTFSGQTSDLYEISGPGGAFSILNRAEGAAGALIGGVCGAGLGGSSEGGETEIATHAISEDGSVVYFSARAGEGTLVCNKTAPVRLFKRVDNTHTTAVSASQCTRVAPPCAGTDGDDRFRGASADGSVVFFTSPRQLSNTDEDTTSDLYLYDSSPPAGQPSLVQVSAGEAVGAHTVGKGAKALGVLDSSADGSRVYFVAEGTLTGANGAGSSPQAAKPNLYVYERDEAHPGGRIAFVGTLLPNSTTGDEKQWLTGENGLKSSFALPLGGGAGDGHILVFVVAAKLLGADTDAAKDLYRYDDLSGQLLCLSCAGNGAYDVEVSQRTSVRSQPDYAQEAAVASADASTVVFVTGEALLPDDTNAGNEKPCIVIIATGCDVYAWHEGQLSLISGGTEAAGIRTGSQKTSGVSADGRDVFFTTKAQLVAGDGNGANDLYDARIGGGFPAAGAPAGCADTEACQGGTPQPGPEAPSPGSASFAGPGNPIPPAPCGKGEVKKHGRCVKKHRHHHRRAGHRRRAGL